MHLVTDAQRRARLGRRQGLAQPLATVEEAVRSVVCLHATEPPSVHLAVAARTRLGVDDVERALYADRTLHKQLAMRRTLFAFPRDLLAAVLGSASARVAAQQQARLAKEVVAAGIADDGPGFLASATADVLASLAEVGPATTLELRQRLPALDHRVEVSPGKPYGGTFAIGPRVLTAIGATGRIVRGHNTVDWRQMRPRWTLAGEWLGEAVAPLTEPEGYAELVRRWLAAFGPGTETDVVWWLGATKGAVRRALADLEAVQVELEGGSTGWVLPEDLDDVLHGPEPEPWAALLPVLDPTLMGWKERAFYLDPADVPYLFDTNGNGGTTAWWDGRVVGCWVQDDAGVVQVVLRGDPGGEARAALEAEAARLTEWFGGVRISSVYSSAQMKSARLP